jgi:acetoin utilization protein AcuC
MTPRPERTLIVVHGDELGMRYGDDHPMDGRRHRLAVDLCRRVGVFDREDIALRGAPEPMADGDLARVFAPAFIAAVRRYSANPALAAEPEARQWGIGGDNTAYVGMHEDSARVVAACADAAQLVADGETRRAMVPAGGSHHGLSNRAWGFGLYNETAMAVRVLRDAGAERVAYIDLDVHHGNGTQWIFYDDPTVLTASIHESGRHLFPGSGFPDEVGGPGAEGTGVNVALPPFAGDDGYRRAFSQIVAPVVAQFRPDAIRSHTSRPPWPSTPSCGPACGPWPTSTAGAAWWRWAAAATTRATRRPAPGHCLSASWASTRFPSARRRSGPTRPWTSDVPSLPS